MIKVLVTGASGFIGRNFTALCLSRGYSVRAQYRRSLKPKELGALELAYPESLECVQADLSWEDAAPNLQESSFRSWIESAKKNIPETLPWWPVPQKTLEEAKKLLDGCNAIMHIAGFPSDWASLETAFNANVNPLYVMGQAALSLRKPPAFVLVSSMAVHGFGNNTRNTEEGAYFKVSNSYQLSKRLAESLAQDLFRQKLPISIVRPANIYGPGDTTTFYQLFDALQKGLMGTLGGGKALTCPLQVDDLCEWMLRALEKTLKLERSDKLQKKPAVWNLSHPQQCTWKEQVDLCCDALGKKRRYPNMPGFLALGAAWLLENLFGLFRSPSAPPLTLYRVKQVLNNYDFDPKKAQEELDYSPKHDLAEGLKACAEAFLNDSKQN